MNEFILPSRAEEMKGRVFDFFVRPPQSFYSRLLHDKAAVLLGGRGTGKTILFKSLALEYKANTFPVKEIWETDKYIGCYIRIDSYIVSNFKGRGVNEDIWGNLFAHYFNLRVTQQVVKNLKILIKGNCIKENSLEDFIQRYYEIIGEEPNLGSLSEMERSLRIKLDELVRFVNNINNVEEPTLINNGLLIFDLCNTLMSAVEDRSWYLLLDEFENLSEYQQRIINTLIKANQPPVIFKIAMRPGGWWTQQTQSLSESLENIADFDFIDFQTSLSDSDYEQLVIDAFSKALALNGIVKEEFLDVRNLLPELSPEDEAKNIQSRSKKNPEYINRIQGYLSNYSEDKKIIEWLQDVLILSNEPLRTRMHLVLLDRGIPPNVIAKEREDCSPRYREWYIHNRIGTLYLFCSDYKLKKTYAGFETFILLSSRIMRNFVSLFSRTLELGIEEGFSFADPQPFNYGIQSKAASDVSQKKVFEIASYATIGPSLSLFANQLGRIFEQLNKDVKQSQPERNHFGINDEVKGKGINFIKGALLNSVLQDTPATKVKNSVDVRGRDYLLNRIYCPYYNISFRKMHKLELKFSEFELLISGGDAAKKEALLIINKYIKSYDDSSPQLSFLDSLFLGEKE